MTGRAGSDARAARGADTHDTNRFSRDTPTIQQGPTIRRRQWQVRKKTSRTRQGSAVRGRKVGKRRGRVRLRIAACARRAARRAGARVDQSRRLRLGYSQATRSTIRRSCAPSSACATTRSSRPRSSTSRIHPDDLPAYRRALVAHLKGDTPRFVSEYRYLDNQRSSGAGRARAASRNAMPRASPTA